jgi:hypothetical protein
MFFELLKWFCTRCCEGNRPPIEELIDGLDGGSPNLRLYKRLELGPFIGKFDGQGRKLNARFSYNKRFGPSKERSQGGSWTRALHPDYTLTFWPEGMDEQKAERDELLVHVHFDAKYRVENIESLFGVDGADDADEEVDGNYKRQDLLKMHAYRDAIKRSQGAYVLYPGRSNKPEQFRGFHELLPGLGAFAISPNEVGDARGMDELSTFLEDMLVHISNRMTAMERSSYHLLEAYSQKESKQIVTPLSISELDVFGEGLRALPPAEHMVMVAWNFSSEQIAWIKVNGVGIIRLGPLNGGWRIQSDFSGLRHLLLHCSQSTFTQGLWRLRKPGYRIFSDNDVRALGYPLAQSNNVYAVFDLEVDQGFISFRWTSKNLFRAIKQFEKMERFKIAKNIGRQSNFPRMLSLANLLEANRKAIAHPV